MNFNDIGMDKPLNNKPNQGSKKKTRSCLQHQVASIEQAPTSSKRHKPNDAALSIENICKLVKPQ